MDKLVKGAEVKSVVLWVVVGVLAVALIGSWVWFSTRDGGAPTSETSSGPDESRASESEGAEETQGSADGVVTNLEFLEVAFLGPPTDVHMIRGGLAENTPLPATVELGVPAGSAVIWAGEISGGDSDEDIATDYEFNRTESGYNIYRLTLETYRTFQIEAKSLYLFGQNTDGSMWAQVSYLTTNRVDTAKLGVEAPPNYAPASIGMTNLGPSPNGAVWGKTYRNVEPGTEMNFRITIEAADQQ